MLRKVVDIFDYDLIKMRQAKRWQPGSKLESLEYYRTFLKKNCHLDGRELVEFRTTTVNISLTSTADGSTLVNLRNTTVICGIKVDLQHQHMP